MTEKKSSTGILGAIFLLLSLLLKLLPSIFYVFYVSLHDISIIILAVLLFMRKYNILTVASVGLIVLSDIIYIDLSFGWLLSFVSDVLLLFIAAVCLTDKLPNFKGICKKLWFLPAVFSLLYFAYRIIFPQIGLELLISDVLIDVLLIIAYFLIAKWFIAPMKSATIKDTSTSPQADTVICAEGYCDMLKHVLLLFFTFGIWYYIWIYRTTKHLNVLKDEPERNPTTKLLLCMFIPFYIIYWTYKSAQRIDKIAVQKNIPSDIAVMCLVLSFIVPIVTPIMMQSKINDIASK